MNNRERAMAILHYEKYDRMPAVHFGFWGETLYKWYEEGHLTLEEAQGCGDGSQLEKNVEQKLGFDFNWNYCVGTHNGFIPGFEEKVISVNPDGSRHYLNGNGVTILIKDGAGSIPAEIDHLLKDRDSWEKYFLPKLQFSPERVNLEFFKSLKGKEDERQQPLGFHCGSLYGRIRDIVGFEGLAYLQADDEDLFDEIINTIGDLSYKLLETAMTAGVKFDFGHFWEDICFKNGPLINPKVFEEKVGPHYKRMTDLLNKNGIDIVSLDCDGFIDALIPTWLSNGVNTMFPIEVGTWNASIKPWREKYGKALRGVGGMNKNVFALDYDAIDKEIERLKPLVDLGGFIPCPDHRIPPTAKWENVQYYCDKIKLL